MHATYKPIKLLLVSAAVLLASASARMPVADAEAVRPTTAEAYEQDMSWVRLKKEFPGKFVTNGPRSTMKVALTFDDAPDSRFTPQILDILKEKHVRATFFIVGYRAQDHKELTKRIHREGHEIGNHSYNHPNFAKLSTEQFRRQVSKTDRIIRSMVGYSPRFLRPPYGELLPQQVKWTSRQGYTVVNWDVDSVDWRNSPSSVVLSNIRSTLRPGSIILQHAGGGEGQDLSGTIAALPSIIEELEEQGYELVPLSELLGQQKTRLPHTKNRQPS